MTEEICAWCDESCHLENDGQKSMVLGAVWAPASHRKLLARRLKEIKKKFGISSTVEIKWVKVSPAMVDFYLALVDLFFDEDLLHFRAVVVPDKQALDHDRFAQSHDEFYYKMWYQLLRRLPDPDHRYRFFIDIKDTQGAEKVRKLHEILCNANHDFDRRLIQSIEQVHSHDVPLLQIADLLIGAIAYAHRGLRTSTAKARIVDKIRHRSGLSLLQSSLVRAEKLNLFVWRPQH